MSISSIMFFLGCNTPAFLCVVKLNRFFFFQPIITCMSISPIF